MSNPFTLTVTKTSTSSTRIITNRSLGRHNATGARQVLRDARLSMGAPAGGQCGWRKLLAPNSLALQVEPRDFREAWPGQKMGLRWFKGLVDVGWWGQVPAMMEDSIFMHLLQFDDEIFEYIWWYVDGGEPRTNRTIPGGFRISSQGDLHCQGGTLFFVAAKRFASQGPLNVETSSNPQTIEFFLRIRALMCKGS